MEYYAFPTRKPVWNVQENYWRILFLVPVNKKSEAVPSALPSCTGRKISGEKAMGKKATGKKVAGKIFSGNKMAGWAWYSSE